MNDHTAFETLYKNHYGKLRHTADHIIGDTDTSHDIVQEVFLKLWHKKESLDTIIHQKAYLFRSVINASLTYLETHKPKHAATLLTLKSHDLADSALSQKELEHKIQRALNSLPPKCKTIFILSRFEEMKYKEIAEHLGVSLKTVENQMGIALKKMRLELSPYLTKEFMALAIGAGVASCLHYLAFS